jgi:predicted dehydrogenase
MVRTQIQLTEEQAAELKRLAAERGVSVAEVVRGFVDKGMRASRGMSWEERKRRALAVVGKYHGPVDLSERHDDYFVESIAGDKGPA